MSSLVYIAFAVVVLLALALVVARKIASAPVGESDAAADLVYQVRPSVLSAAERSFVGVLEPLLPEGVGYLLKIRLGDVFTTRKGLHASRRAGAWNRINQKHVDMLLVDTRDLRPLAGIELDDSSHADERRKTRDAFVDDVFHACGVPLLHVPAQGSYNPAELRAKIASTLGSYAAAGHARA